MRRFAWLLLFLLVSPICIRGVMGDSGGTAHVVTTYPSYSNIDVSTTLVGEVCEFQVLWLSGSGNLSWCGFTWNGTGTWISNETVWTDGENLTRWANVTKTLPSIVGTVVGFRWYCNNTEGYMTDTGIQTLTTTQLMYATTEYVLGVALAFGGIGVVALAVALVTITKHKKVEEEKIDLW